MIIAIFHLSQANKHRYDHVLFANETLAGEEKRMQGLLPQDLSANDIVHWCMIPMVNESYEILRDTLQALKESNYNLTKLAVTVNGEAAKKEHFLSVRSKLESEFSGIFGYFNYTLHELASDEMIGK